MSFEAGKQRMFQDALAQYLGIELVEIKPGYARATLEVKAELLNGLGFTHGGAIFSLADIVFAAASNSHGPEALALSVNISFIKATTVGERLTAIAKEDNLTRRTGLYRIEVRDSQDELVSIAEGLVYRKA